MSAEDPDLWKVIASARPSEVWAGILAGMFFVYSKSPSPSTTTKLTEVLASGLIGYAVGDWAAEWAGVHRGLSALLVTACGYMILDVARSLVSDRKMFKEVVLRRLGGRDE